MIRAICDKCGEKASHKLIFKKYPLDSIPLVFFIGSIPDATLEICTGCFLEMIKKTADYSQVKS